MVKFTIGLSLMQQSEQKVFSYHRRVATAGKSNEREDLCFPGFETTTQTAPENPGKEQKRKRLDQPRQANVPQRKKGALSFYSLRVFDPEGLSPFQWVRTLRRCSWAYQKRKRLDQPRQANVPERIKGALSFYSLRVI
ncbi:hypothetical protein ACQCVP_15005 [Rossellomorea vietnamensis]|uniref:hypothetical protein n=1 Tax=Rossellomorea vietnamensis TaxID=218284 RepID=UPI003CEA1C6C